MSNTEQEIQEKNEQIKEEKEKFFIDENEQRRVEASTPSGRFKMVIRYYSTKKGCWNYSRGTIYDLEGNEICDIKRNYSSFHHSFIVKDGQEWLITGRSYMSQTIINLDTGEIFEPSGDQYKGSAFCWAGEALSPDEQVLIVEGCYWAAPYEYKFFDFSDPSKGWPELKIYENGEHTYLCIDQGDCDDPLHPKWNEDRTVTTFDASQFFLPLQKYENDIEMEELDALSGEYDKPENWRIDVDQKVTLQRQGDQMVIIDRWRSEVELERIKQRKINNEKYKKWEKEFKSSDPLYLEYLRQIKNPALSVETYEGRGITYEGWCPDFKEQESRWCRRIAKKDDNQPYTIDLEWAVKTGPIKLQIFKDGKKYEDKFFGHSEEEMEQAFLYAHDLITQ
jgi:hypothetical protein